MKPLSKAIIGLLAVASLLVSLTLSAAIDTASRTIGSFATGSPSSDSPSLGSRFSGSSTFESLTPNSSVVSLASSLAVDKASSSINKRYIGNNLADYQSNPNNQLYQIPPHVLLNRDGMLPDGGQGFGAGGGYNLNIGGQGLEIMFSDQEIWDAMNAGYSQLRDASYAVHTWPNIATREQYAEYARLTFPRWGQGNQIRFPNELRPDQIPRLGRNGPAPTIFEHALWPLDQTTENVFANQRVFVFPILAQRTTFNGGTAPGPYRVVFNQNGQYMGVVRHRSRKMRNGAQNNPTSKDGDWNDRGLDHTRLVWLNPVFDNGMPIGMYPHGSWPYPGTPGGSSANPDFFQAPFNWARTSDLEGIYYQISHPLPMPPKADDSAYWFGNFSNSTAGNASIASQRTGDNGLNCDTAKQYVNQTYDTVCESRHYGNDGFMDYTIFATGIGGDSGAGWCQGIRDNIKGQCGGNAKFASEDYFYCNPWVPGNAQLYHNPNTGKVDFVWGLMLKFRLLWAWAERDADHDCIQRAIEKGSCLSHWVDPTFPVVCRDYDWFNVSLTEYDWDFQGPPAQ